MFDEIIAPLLTTEWGRRLGLGLLFLFAIFCIITLINFPMTLYSDFALAYGPAEKIPHLQLSDQAEDVIGQIPSRHLFGFAASKDTAIPITSLQLRLIGVIKGTPESTSRVIISEQNGVGKIYRIGDTLTAGVKISGITTDGVILENGGHLEKLPLQRTSLEFEEPPKSSF